MELGLLQRRNKQRKGKQFSGVLETSRKFIWPGDICFTIKRLFHHHDFSDHRMRISPWIFGDCKGSRSAKPVYEEPDFQIRITQEACSTLMETSADTENMVFFPKEFLENIKQTAGNSLQDETKIQGFYPIIGKQGRDSIKLLNDGETVPTVIQKNFFF